jgi:NADPH:quinone reductase-like Zn-dependent oxidoreductase
MQAYLLTRSGKPEVLKKSEVPDPVPATGEVLINIERIGLNYAEVLSRQGLYGWAPKRPYIPGMECAGIIAEVGADVTEFKPGDRVMVGAKFGCYAEKVVVNAAQALRPPAHLSELEHPAFAVNFMTAWVGLKHLARLEKNETVIITAAAGGVGSAAVMLALKMGARVFALAGSPDKIRMLQEMGVTGAVNYREPGWPEQLRQMCGGADVVFEMVGGQVFRSTMKLLNPFGRVAILGFAGLNLKWWNPLSWYQTLRDIPRAGVSAMAEQSIGIMSSHLGYLLDRPEMMQQIWSGLTEFVSRHQLRPVVGHEFNFDELPEAHRYMESRASTGKIIISLPQASH